MVVIITPVHDASRSIPRSPQKAIAIVVSERRPCLGEHVKLFGQKPSLSPAMSQIVVCQSAIKYSNMRMGGQRVHLCLYKLAYITHHI